MYIFKVWVLSNLQFKTQRYLIYHHIRKATNRREAGMSKHVAFLLETWLKMLKYDIKSYRLQIIFD